MKFSKDIRGKARAAGVADEAGLHRQVQYSAQPPVYY